MAKTQKIERAETQWRAASERLAAAVLKRFPIGKRILVKWGRGQMFAEVFCAPCAWSSPGTLGVRSHTGNAHSIYWRDILA